MCTCTFKIIEEYISSYCRIFSDKQTTKRQKLQVSLLFANFSCSKLNPRHQSALDPFPLRSLMMFFTFNEDAAFCLSIRVSVSQECVINVECNLKSTLISFKKQLLAAL